MALHFILDSSFKERAADPTRQEGVRRRSDAVYPQEPELPVQPVFWRKGTSIPVWRGALTAGLAFAVIAATFVGAYWLLRSGI